MYKRKPGRRLPRRRLHQHAVRGAGRRRDLRGAQGAPRRRHDETTEDGKITLEHAECNAACDYAPVVMVNWEFFDNRPRVGEAAGRRPAGGPRSPRPAARRLCTFKEMRASSRRLPDEPRRRGRGRRARPVPPRCRAAAGQGGAGARWPGRPGSRGRPAGRDTAGASQFARRAAADLGLRSAPSGRSGRRGGGVMSDEVTQPREAAGTPVLTALGRGRTPGRCDVLRAARRLRGAAQGARPCTPTT
jgi:hypothetical protein